MKFTTTVDYQDKLQPGFSREEFDQARLKDASATGTADFSDKKKKIFVDIRAGLAIKIHKCVEWENDISINPLPVEVSLVSNEMISGTGDVLSPERYWHTGFDNDIPVLKRKDRKYTLKQAYVFQYSTNIVLWSPLKIATFAGLNASVAQFTLSYEDKVLASGGDKASYEPESIKKTSYGFGGQIGIQYAMSKKMRLVLLGGFKIYNKTELSFDRDYQINHFNPDDRDKKEPIATYKVEENIKIDTKPIHLFAGAAIRYCF